MTGSEINKASRLRVVLTATVLAVAVLIAYSPSLWNGFVDLDDPDYIFDNPVVSRGLTVDGVVWAFQTRHMANWHPAAWISHMADVSIFGVENPGGHHAVSVVLHAANAVLLFLLFLRMTGAFGPALLAAALFALHPLRVESVAWVAERKDLLCATFGLLSLHAYAGYVAKPSVRRYLAVAAFFALALMSKAMLVTLPVLLLLVDFWPLSRREPLSRLALEKVPLLAISAACSAVALFSQRIGGTVAGLGGFSAADRLETAVVAAVAYLYKSAVPTGLSYFYPHPVAVGQTLPAWSWAGACILLAGISATAVALRRRAPYLLFGWGWYLVALLPVSGVVQIGAQSMADRYTYLPTIGVAVAVAWGIFSILDRPTLAAFRRPSAVAGLCVLFLLATLAFDRTKVWRDSESLATQALAVDPRNYDALDMLGGVAMDRGDYPGAVALYRKGLSIRPGNPPTMASLGVAIGNMGDISGAASCFEASVAAYPVDADTWRNLSKARRALGQTDAANVATRRADALDAAVTSPSSPSSKQRPGAP